MTDNLTIWSKVEKTDPAFTKNFNRGGGFKGTATNPTYLAKRATEIFGPCGIGWGVTVERETYTEGAPISDGVREIIHTVYVCLWYDLDGKRGEIRHFGSTTFVGKNKYGAFTDEEAAKKSLTDATTKCLSLLGFAADIHSGRYDDHKYVNDLRQEFSDKPVRDDWYDPENDGIIGVRGVNPPHEATADERARAYAEGIIRQFQEVKTIRGLPGAWERNQRVIDVLERKWPDLHADVFAAYEARQGALQAEPKKSPAEAAIELLDACDDPEQLDTYAKRISDRWGDDIPPDVAKAEQRCRIRLAEQDSHKKGKAA